MIGSCRYNEKYLLHILRLKQRDSKANLARETGLTAAAVGSLIKSLQDKGLVENVGKVQGDMGQPATLFSLSKNGAYGLGVSLNRGHIETVMINFVGEIVASKKHDLILPSPEEAQAIIIEDIRVLLDAAPAEVGPRIAGIGVAQPGQMGSWSQGDRDWSDWDEFDLAAQLSQAFRFPAYSQNDVSAAAIAELIYGGSPATNDFLYVFFGGSQVQSFGGGLILNGECRDGGAGNAGDVGLIPVGPSTLYGDSAAASEDDKGLNADFLTHRCALSSLVTYLKSEGFSIENAEDFHRVIALEPERVGRWLSDCVMAFERAIFAIQAVVDVPELIIDCEDADAYLIERVIEGLKARLASNLYTGIHFPQIRKGGFGSDASAIGAATLPLDSSFSLKK